MHGYSGNQALWPATIDLGDDSIDPPTFLTWNIGFEGLADRTAYLHALAVTPNFHPSVALAAATVIGWDWLTLKWLVGGSVGAGTIGISTGRGEINSWPTLIAAGSPFSGTLVSICRGAEPSVTNRYVYAYNITSTQTPFVVRVDTVGNAWNASEPAGPITDATGGAIASLAGVVIVGIGSSTAADSNLYTSTNQGGTWTPLFSVVPGTAIPNWLFAQSAPGGGKLVAMPTWTGVGGATYVTSDGVTWATGSAGIGATETPTTLAWGLDGNGNACCLLTTTDTGSPFVTRTYQSADGLTWTAIANNLPTGLNTTGTRATFYSMASVGPMFVGVVLPGATARALYSADGGATWQEAMANMPSSGLGAVASSPNQFFIATGSRAALSLCYGSPGGIGPT